MPSIKLLVIAVATFFAATCLAASGSVAVADTVTTESSPAKSGPQHLRVIWRGDTGTTAIVSWSTTSPGKGHLLHWRSPGEDTWQRTKCHRNGKFSRGNGLWFHHARLTGLKPGTRYEVKAESKGQQSGAFSFRTAPAAGEPFQLLFGGDSRSSQEHRRKMNALLRRLVNEADQADRPPVVALAHGGDFVNNGRLLHEWREWLDDYAVTTSKDGELLPIIPTRGNHDYSELFNEVFDFPTGDTNYYTTSLTPAVTLLTLNTETSTAGDQLNWLRAQLESPPAGQQWLLTQYHKPAFPAVKAPSGAYGSWVPLFEKYGVDLCLEADGHCIKRTPPILGHEIDPNGVVYVGEGGLGVGQRTPQADRWYLRSPGVVGQGHHIHLFTFDGPHLTGRVIREDGSVFDEFSLVPRDKQTPQASPKTKAPPTETAPPAIAS